MTYIRAVAMSIAALLVSLAFAGSAAALPEDPRVQAISPADGANLAATELGLKVTYSCPSYRTAIEVEEEEVGFENEAGEIETEIVERQLPVIVGSEGYGVRFSTSSQLGSDGRLVSSGFEFGEVPAQPLKGTSDCSSELFLPTAPNPAALYQGKVYWQAFRLCEECAKGFEVGPVRSFVVVPTVEGAEINYEDHPYGGYMTKVSFRALASLKGAKVALQRWTGSEWLTIAEEPGSQLGENDFYVTLGAGHKLLRPVVIGNGVTMPLEEKAKTVRRARKAAAAAVATGEWVSALEAEREEFPLSFRVTQGGTVLSGLSAQVGAICVGPNKEKTVIEASSSVKSVPIAPDGTVVAHFATTGATPSTVTLTGNFFDGRFSGQLLSEFLTCQGLRQFEAVASRASIDSGR